MTAPKDDPTIVVVFRTWRDKDRDVIALFPAIPATYTGRYCTSYMHIGQHSAASYHGCIAQTRPATASEYAPLLKELRAIGYDNLVIRKRYTQTEEHANENAKGY